MDVLPGPITLQEFLAWERRQPFKYEFDAVQPIPVHGGAGQTVRHARIVRDLLLALHGRLREGHEVLGGGLMVLTSGGRARYPDAVVTHGPVEADAEIVVPAVVFEVVSRASELVDHAVKAAEYAATASLAACVMLEQERREAVLRRRCEGWAPRKLTAAEDVLALPEVGAAVTLGELYRGFS